MPDRRYRSPRRETAAAATRAAILDSAARLFVDKGYASTAMPEIAAAAAVSVPTLYASVGNKSQLLIGLLERAATDVAIEEAMRAVEAADTPDAILEALSSGTRTVAERHEWLVSTLYDNAAAEPEIRLRLDAAISIYHDNLRRSAQRMEGLRALRTELDVRTAATVLWFYFGFGAWRTLREAGWTWTRAEQWLRARASAAVLKSDKG